MKRTIRTPEDFQAAMGSVKTAMEIVNQYDWADLMSHISLLESIPDVDRVLHGHMIADPQWELKKRVFMAASAFTHELKAIEEQVGAS